MALKHKFPPDPILVVDDEISALEGIEVLLHSAGFTNVMTCNDSRDVMELIRSQNVQMILLDLIMPHISGNELIKMIHAEFPETHILIVTAVDEVRTVVECMCNGATDYLLKPLEKGHLKNRILKSLELQDLKTENAILRDRILTGKLEHPDIFSEIITQNRDMLSIFRYCESIAISSYPVMITGETGTGKGLIAKAVHSLSNRRGEFVAVNIAAFDESLFAAALFGHVKGAFTGADERRPGLVEKANGGTLFLDEIGDLDKISQIKLLRLLQEREYSPVGSDTIKNANIRLITSTNRNLKARRDEGKFREDLYYRLMSHHVHLPPLRDRADDIPLLLDHFLEEASADMHKTKPTYHPELIKLLRSYNFPGNIRELQHIVADAVAKHTHKMLSSQSFREYIQTEIDDNEDTKSKATSSDTCLLCPEHAKIPRLKDAINVLTRNLIEDALAKSGGNQTIAARMLGISQQSLSSKIAKLEQRS